MTAPAPPPRDLRELTTELRKSREECRESGAALVPVEGGAPIPAEEPAPTARSDTF